jgi:hypothetical protein
MTFRINPSFGAGVPSGYVTSVDEAIHYFEDTFHNDVTLNINFDFAPLTGGDVGESDFTPVTTSYSNIINALLNTDSGIAADRGLVVPNSDPFSGDFFMSPSDARAIGFTVSGISSDGTVTLNSNDSYTSDPNNVGPGQFDAVGVLEHEISEVMGRNCGNNGRGVFPTPLALFRYSSPNVIDTTDGIGDHFSINGTTSLHANMGEPGGDLADWNSSTGDCVGFAVEGRKQSFSAADVRVMEAMGWRTGGAATTTALAPVEGTNALALSSLLATGHDFSA